MKEIFVHESEMPKGCTFCLLNRDYSWDMSSCCLRGMGIGDNKAIKHCPLRSLEQHDSEVRAKAIQEFLERAKEYVRACKECGYDGIGELDIDDLVAELLQGEESKND